MLLNPTEQDALGELVNIGFGRAASALSMLVSQRVLLDAPEVNLLPTSNVAGALTPLTDRELINIHQVFRGKLSGSAMLLMDSDSATVLVDMLDGGAGTPHPLDASDREALVEIGNILLNAFIGSFGNLLKVHITFTVPHLKLGSLEELMDALSSEKRKMEYALIVKIRFRLTQGNVSGYVVIVMGIESLETLLNAMREEGYFL